jgi:multidrug efflux pump subunit AcrA (membrane-fusion protein)
VPPREPRRRRPLPALREHDSDTHSFVHHQLILVASALAVAGCGKGAAPEAAGAKAPEQIEIGRENVVEVQSQAITVGPLVSGELKAEREATVRAEIGGSVLQVFPQEGQSVAAGALLARIEGQPVHDAYASAQSTLRSAEQTSEWAQKEAARIENLVKGGALAERDAEVARNAATQAKAAADDARSRVASMRKSLDDLTVKAPIAGVVSKRHVNAGDVVSPGGELYTIIDHAARGVGPVGADRGHPCRRQGHVPGPRLPGAVRGAHRARQPDRRFGDPPGADLRDHSEQAAPPRGRRYSGRGFRV